MMTVCKHKFNTREIAKLKRLRFLFKYPNLKPSYVSHVSPHTANIDTFFTCAEAVN